MAMNGDTLGADIADLLYASDATPEAKADVLKLWKKIGGVIVKHIQDNAEITVPAGSVIISVAGQATGTPNAAPIATDVQ